MGGWLHRPSPLVKYWRWYPPPRSTPLTACYIIFGFYIEVTNWRKKKTINWRQWLDGHWPSCVEGLNLSKWKCQKMFFSFFSILRGTPWYRKLWVFITANYEVQTPTLDSLPVISKRFQNSPICFWNSPSYRSAQGSATENRWVWKLTHVHIHAQ